MNNAIFREYDIRGVIGKDVQIEETYDLGRAIITYLRRKHPEASSLVIGHDARSHSLPIQENIIKAAIDYGFDVIDVGLCPTPVVYFAGKKFNTPLAIVITASHNPKEYNGIKIWDVWGSQVQEIKNIYNAHAFTLEKSHPGSLKTYNIIDEYVAYMAHQFAHLKNLSIDAVVDCGNGAAGPVFSQLVDEMNWSNVSLLYADPDGNFPHHEADPTVPENMQDVKEILAKDDTLLLGLGFDGDADRMDPMTKSGELVAGDKMLALYAERILQDYPGAAVVFDIKSSSSLIELLTKWGAKPCISPSGYSKVKKTSAENDAKLAGELSCHFIFYDRYLGFDDGIYAALRLFELLAQRGKTLDQLLEIFPEKVSSPELRIKCSSDEQKLAIVDHVLNVFAQRKDVEILTIDGMRVTTPYGWGLLRASNTQTVICLRFESTTQEGYEHIKDDFYRALQPFFDEKTLREYI